MKKLFFVVAVCISACSAAVQPLNSPACLYETVQSDAGMSSFRTVQFSSLNDCRQYRELCNREAERCTECCDSCYSR